MNPNNLKPFSRADAVVEFFLRFAASGYLPGRWFNRHMPSAAALSRAEEPVHIEIVSHCWNYAQFLIYQLSALVLYPPKECRITHTVFYSQDDKNTVELLDCFASKSIKNVRWNFIALPKPQLFRRSIGRNLAAKSTVADWVWFADCDVLFYNDALDCLARQLVGSQQILVYPKRMLVSPRLDNEHPLIRQGRDTTEVIEIDTSTFTAREYARAIGPIQIVHGDIARKCGYCDSLSVYQKTTDRWRKTYEDRAFRWLLGTQGVPIDIPHLYFIRHAEKGRYQSNSISAKIRKAIRKLQFAVHDR